MTLQRRMMLLLLLSAPLVWTGGLLFSLDRARHEINELFDTQLIRLARQMQSTLPLADIGVIDLPPAETAVQATLGDAELEDMATAVWNRDGRLLLVDREGVLLPRQPDASGFQDMTLGGELWRVYYLQASTGAWLVAVGQIMSERDELVWDLIAGQLLPWALTLPVLLLVMAAAVRQALKPVRTLTGEIDRRAADDLQPLPVHDMPSDLQPLVRAMNTMLARIADMLDRERRFTADAAHELRTPLAALQAQWDAARLSLGAPVEGNASQDKIGLGLSRLSRLVTQMLAMARLDHLHGQTASTPIVWPDVVEQVINEVLPLADRERVELACEWPGGDAAPLPLSGDASLLASMLRNLIENALRHTPPNGHVTLRLSADGIEVLDEGPGVPPEHLPRLGDRFFRPPGEETPGSGLGLSIVRRIAELHGLTVDWGPREEAQGFRVRLRRNTPRQQALGQASAGH